MGWGNIWMLIYFLNPKGYPADLKIEVILVLISDAQTTVRAYRLDICVTAHTSIRKSSIQK